MRTLVVCSSWPLGGSFGGQIRTLQTARVLQQFADVSLLVVATDALDPEARELTDVEFETQAPIVPRLRLNRSLTSRLRWGFDTTYLNLHGLVADGEDCARVIDLMPRHDLVWVINSRTPNILQQWRWPKAHLDIDDVPSTYYRAAAQSGGTARDRWKAQLLQWLMKRRELRWRERFVTLSVCSDEDKRYLGGGDEMHVIPNGFERPVAETARLPSTTHPRIGFIGLYDYEPNRDGVNWFLRRCWPAIASEVPGARLRLVGKGTDGPDGPKGVNVDTLGFVEDSAAEIATWSAMVIPIRLGGGTRIKIADAFSRKCPVVSTSLGAYGYGVEDGKQLRLADTPEKFAAACIDVIQNRAESDAMVERAYQEFLEKWTWDAIAPRVWAAAEDCLRRSRDQGRRSTAIS